MKDAIVLSYRPFVATQNIFVFNKEGEIIKQAVVLQDDIVNGIYGLANEHSIKNVFLRGNKDMLSNIHTKLTTKYNSLNVEIIQE